MITIIAAISDNNVIGINGKIPWHLPSDLKRFKELTIGKPIVMGRKTFESIGKPLQNRLNVIITSNEDYSSLDDNVLIINEIEDVFLLEKQFKEIFIIGGQKIYEYFLPCSDKMYLTLIEKIFDGDSFFPEINMNLWKINDFEEMFENNLKFTFIDLIKK